MKTFKDLVFETHKVGTGLHARMEFENGYGVSVIRFKLPSIAGMDLGYGSYTSGSTWEVAVMRRGKICYDTPITDDVLGHQTSKDVTKIMVRVQKLPNAT